MDSKMHVNLVQWHDRLSSPFKTICYIAGLCKHAMCAEIDAVKETRFWGVKNEWEVDNIFQFDGLVRMD